MPIKAFLIWEKNRVKDVHNMVENSFVKEAAIDRFLTYLSLL